MSAAVEAQIRSQPAWTVAGLLRQHTQMPSPGIPSQWQDFTPYIGSIAGQVGDNTYGIVPHEISDDLYSPQQSYLCAVEVSDPSRVPEPLTALYLPPQTYAVFWHADHVSLISQTFAAAFSDWLPASDYVAVAGACVEAYGVEFDPATGNGGCEVWIPVVLT